MTPQPPAQTDPLDFTNQYNTPIPPQQQSAYQQWAKSVGQDPVKGKYDYDLQGAFLGGAGQSGNGHFPDTYKKPNHPTFSDQSQYHGVDGYVGGTWTDAGYQPSTTNLQFRPPQELQNYFNRVEPGTKLLDPATVPAPSGRNGQYQMSDFSPTYRVKKRPAQSPAPPLAPQPIAPRKYYGQ